MNKIFLGK